jgi:transposase-like protein
MSTRSRRKFTPEFKAEAVEMVETSGGLVDEYVLLAGKEPGQGAGGEFVTPLAQQMGGPAPHGQIEL